MIERSRKICPLLKEVCKNVNCVWWNKLGKNCSINMIADTLDTQAGTVRDILNRG